MPEVRCVTKSFLNTIVEVVSKATHLRLDFHRRDQLAVSDNQQVPFLRGPEKSRQRPCCFAGGVYARAIQACIGDDVAYQSHKPVGVFAARNSSPITRIQCAGFASLTRSLRLARRPEVADCIG